MALLVPDAGEANMLDELLKNTTPEAQKLKLYKNDISPAEGDTAATYVAADISGYAEIALTRGTWGAASTSGGTTTSTYPQQTFNFTGTGVIVGYYVVKATAGTILWAERIFSTPGQTFNNGDSLKLTAKLVLE